MKKNMDPFWWGLFSAGGVLSAFFLPILLLLNGLVFPLGWLEAPQYPELFALVKHPLTRLFLFGLISLSLIHWAHRFRSLLIDGLQLKHWNAPIAILCYGMAIVGALVSALILWNA